MEYHLQLICTCFNFHSPYKVWIDKGSYKFLTDYGVQYRIEFVENNNIWERTEDAT